MPDDPGKSRERHRRLELPNNNFADISLRQSGRRVTLSIQAPSEGGGAAWLKCVEDGCFGEAVIVNTCLRHAHPGSRLDYLQSQSLEYLTLRGVEITPMLANEIFSSPIFSNKEINTAIDFTGAEINTELMVADHVFEQNFILDGATINDHQVHFERCTFKRNFTARFAFFCAAPTQFLATTFLGPVRLSYSLVERVSIGFSDCQFAKTFEANGIKGPLLLDGCRIEGNLSFRGADAKAFSLEHCSIGGEIDMANLRCGSLLASHVRVLAARQIGPFEASKQCLLAHAHFGAHVRIDVRTDKLELSGAQFALGGDILVDRAKIYAGWLGAGRPIQISGVVDGEQMPELLALQNADASAMALAYVDLKRCVFHGSQMLRRIVLEPTVDFAQAPSRWYSTRWHTRRKCVADEFAWRRHVGGRSSRRWTLAGTQIADEATKARKHRRNDPITLPTLEASQVAAVYRELRSSLEARSDQPGAADFYYGEMEMRRLSNAAGFAERVIIYVYWILSGYGLRAWRALTWLAVLVVAGGFLMSVAGYRGGAREIEDGLLFALRAAVRVPQRPENLTTYGSCIEIALGLLGPVLLALAVLALRGRVKR